MKLTAAERNLIEPIEPATMLEQTRRWSAINSGTSNLGGLQQQAEELADAFSALPGEPVLHHGKRVDAVDAEGREFGVEHGRHLVLRVRPEAERRFLLTGHMDTVFPPQHPFQHGRWLNPDTYNAPGAADMKGGLAVMLAALQAFEATRPSTGYDVLINADEETGSLSSALLVAELARGKAAALTYEPAALPDGTLAHERGGSGNFSLVVTGRSAHAGRNPKQGRNAIVAAAALALRLKALEHDGLSVNPARIEGRSANNVVPDKAVLRFNIRPKSIAATQAFEADLKRLLDAVKREH